MYVSSWSLMLSKDLPAKPIGSYDLSREAETEVGSGVIMGFGRLEQGGKLQVMSCGAMWAEGFF